MEVWVRVYLFLSSSPLSPLPTHASRLSPPPPHTDTIHTCQQSQGQQQSEEATAHDGCDLLSHIYPQTKKLHKSRKRRKLFSKQKPLKLSSNPCHRRLEHTQYTTLTYFLFSLHFTCVTQGICCQY